MYNTTPINFEKFQNDLKDFLIINAGFDLGKFLFTPFEDTTDHATSLVITNWTTLNSLSSEISFTLEYRELLKSIQAENPSREPLTVFMERCDKLDKSLSISPLQGIGAYINKISIVGKSDLDIDNKKRIYCHLFYKAIYLNK